MKIIIFVLFFTIYSTSYAGFEINDIKFESVYKKLNLQNGDKIQEINKVKINNLSHLLSYFADISKINEIIILRNGQSVLIRPSSNKNKVDEISKLLNEAKAINLKNIDETTTYIFNNSAKHKNNSFYEKLKVTSKIIEIKNKNELIEFDLENDDEFVDEIP